MKIHEYQAKELFRKYNIAVPKGAVASTPVEAVKVADTLGGYPVVVKAQIHAGGRGKGGGVVLAKSENEVSKAAGRILGMKLITAQTGPEGQEVKKVLVEQGLDIAKELYLGILPDRASGKNIIMVSEAGGMNIEEIAETTPEKIVKIYLHSAVGLQPFHCRRAAYGLNLAPTEIKPFMTLLAQVYSVFEDYDCGLLEINPLVVTKRGDMVVLDAKVTFDDSALFRHGDIVEYRDPDEEDPLEVEASKYNINYIRLDGNVGNMVNGAGLAMATMDIIKQAGARPANFLDVGGGASAEMVENGFRIILSDKNVKAILINIFGGILRCDVLANGVVKAAREIGVKIPVVIRMEGTNVEEGRKILAESGLDLITAVDLTDAAKKVAELVAE
ncbi:MAG: ADP-forming succinate--CoA ligase subunit beta [Desulfobacterales bacterium]|jgi:succinyl-CoA synthetase beta subunit|nr:ADP-forming succinate--CoA ligase subunit beta [Desulfobacterales bacterium]